MFLEWNFWPERGSSGFSKLAQSFFQILGKIKCPERFWFSVCSYSLKRLKIDSNDFYKKNLVLELLGKKGPKISFLSFTTIRDFEFFWSFAWNSNNLKDENWGKLFQHNSCSGVFRAEMLKMCSKWVFLSFMTNWRIMFQFFCMKLQQDKLLKLSEAIFSRGKSCFCFSVWAYRT